ncbi:hypothetical protein [Desulfovibrio sp. ZJ369]|uniref:hypothetical protein n=1 Tax=Desulfovibrio sp. ZJ369 TaxID=2709793 RepID=UPI0013E9E1A5|nr:hypothetical protein [Desulfovibrio sp. ZJ369]
MADFLLCLLSFPVKRDACTFAFAESIMCYGSTLSRDSRRMVSASSLSGVAARLPDLAGCAVHVRTAGFRFLTLPLALASELLGPLAIQEVKMPLPIVYGVLVHASSSGVVSSEGQPFNFVK